MNYQEKYIKYKTKYLELTKQIKNNIQKGGEFIPIAIKIPNDSDIIESHQTNSLSCGRHALNNLFRNPNTNSQNDTLFIKGGLNDILDLNIQRPDKNISLFSICKYISQPEENLCTDNENYDTSILQFALLYAGYQVDETGYKKNNENPIKELENIEIIICKSIDSIGGIVNYRNNHWISIVKNIENNKWYSYDSIGSEKTEFNNFEEYFAKNKDKITQILFIKIPDIPITKDKLIEIAELNKISYEKPYENPYVELYEIKDMPQLCFGTAQDDLDFVLPIALENNYNHFDCADAYNEENKVILKNNIKKLARKKFWLTWKSHNISIQNIKKIIKDMECEYIDLFLIHFGCGYDSDYIIFKEVQNLGLIRYYGVSNCEDLDVLIKLKEKHNIYANQIQARPPNGKITERRIIDDNFIEICNKHDIKIMLFASVSAVTRLNLTNYEFVKNINKYYIQKYIKNTKNCLIVSSRLGDSISVNKQIYQTESLLLTKEEFNNTEKILQSLVLYHM
jgi:diketogulonate reductase-like aldo/keto reductase